MIKTTLTLAALLISGSALAGGNIEAGKAAAAKYNCASCHGADYKSPIDPSYPKLAGQHQDYLQHALVAYQRGTGVANGRGNAIMGGMAKPLSKTEVNDLAAYLHSLPGPLVIRRSDAARCKKNHARRGFFLRYSVIRKRFFEYSRCRLRHLVACHCAVKSRAFVPGIP